MARTFTAIPGVVLVICVFLPALRVCGNPTTPITCPPCYAPYFGGIGIAIVALVRHPDWAKAGAAFVTVLDILMVGAIAALMVVDAHVVGAAALAVLTLAVAIVAARAIARSAGRDTTLATIALVHGIGSTIWAALLAFDKDAMWGAQLTLFAALALTVSSIAWLREHADEPPLPTATLR